MVGSLSSSVVGRWFSIVGRSMNCTAARCLCAKRSARLPLYIPGHNGVAKDQRPTTVLLNFHHFFFFGLAHVFHLLDFVVGQLLDLPGRALVFVFSDFLIL